jgi:hypothetical protein
MNTRQGMLLLRSETVWEALKDSRDTNKNCRLGLWSRGRHVALVGLQLFPYNRRPLSGLQIEC